MKHPIQRHGRHQSLEWVSAIFTLLVLVGIYSSMQSFDSYSSWMTQPHTTQEKRLSVATPYWNENLKYGFRSIDGDSYTNTEKENTDQVVVTGPTTRTSPDGTVRVTFYPDTPIDTIEAARKDDSPRAYSRLANGIAVIEGDLNSPSAKTILSTLYPRQ